MFVTSVVVCLQEDMFTKEVSIDARVHPRIIGSKGRGINRIMEDFKVDIRFPRSNDPDPDLVVVAGAEDDVLDCIEHLLNLAEEYVSKSRMFMYLI